MMSFIWILGAVFTFGVYTAIEDIKSDVSSSKLFKRSLLCIAIWPFTLGMAVGKQIFREEDKPESHVSHKE